MALQENVLDMVGKAGELLIRAAAILGALTPEERAALDKETDNQLSGCIALALGSARSLSPTVAQSLKTHPPEGFWREIDGEEG